MGHKALKIYEMRELQTGDAKVYNYLFLAPNIELRSYHILEKYPLENIDNIIAFDFDNFHQEEYEQCFSRLDKYKGSEKISFCKVNDDNFIHLFNSISLSNEDSIAIDITGFSIPQIYKLVSILYSNINVKKVDFFYTEPKHYRYRGGLYNKYHDDIFERVCKPIDGYYSSGRNENEVLIVILGFDNGLSDLVYGCMAEEAGFETYAINGLPSYTVKLKDVSLINNKKLIVDISSNNILYANANNPFSVYNTLSDFRKEHKDKLINICPIGSKPMALGACIFANEQRKNVKATYPFYTKTFFDIDEEAGKTWCYGVNVDLLSLSADK